MSKATSMHGTQFLGSKVIGAVLLKSPVSRTWFRKERPDVFDEKQFRSRLAAYMKSVEIAISEGSNITSRPVATG